MKPKGAALTWVLQTGRLVIQCCPHLYSDFKTCLGYKRSISKQTQTNTPTPAPPKNNNKMETHKKHHKKIDMEDEARW